MDWDKIKNLGIGIGFRNELKPLIFMNRTKIGFLEIIAEHFMDAPKEKMKELDLLMEHFVVIPHAIGLSVGSAEGLDKEYVLKLKNLIAYINPPYWSEHISYTKAHGIDIGHLSPLIYNEAFLNVMEKNIRFLNERINCPLILENITYHVEFPGREFDDAEFLNLLCERTGCGLLLDVTNLYINSKNFGFDPFEFIDRLDLKNVVQLHFVGYENVPGQVIDTHSSKTQKEIFELMKCISRFHQPKGVLIERDDNFENTNEILEDLETATEIFQKQKICN